MEEIIKQSPANWLKNVVVFKTLSIILTIVILIFAVAYGPILIPFWQAETGDIVNMLISLFLIAVFIERANEIILVAWRGKKRQEIGAKSVLKKRQKELTKNEEEKKQFQLEIDEINLELERYSVETRNIALLTALSFGIIISGLGVRTLEPLVDPAVFKGLNMVQMRLFMAVDIFITGALLGGGSNGIHKIIDLFLTQVDVKRKQTKADFAEQQQPS